MHSHFTIAEYNFGDHSYRLSVVKRKNREFSGHPVHWFIKYKVLHRLDLSASFTPVNHKSQSGFTGRFA